MLLARITAILTLPEGIFPRRSANRTVTAILGPLEGMHLQHFSLLLTAHMQHPRRVTYHLRFKSDNPSKQCKYWNFHILHRNAQL